MRALQYIVLISLILICQPLTTRAATWRVPLDSATIQGGINMAAAGDTVLVSNGYYYENDITLIGGILLTSVSGIAGTVVIDGQEDGRILIAQDLAATTTLRGLVVQRGITDSGPGGALFAENSQISIENCNFLRNIQTINNGAAINSNHCTLSLNGCYFSENKNGSWAGAGLALFSDYDHLTITNCIFSDNHSDYSSQTWGEGGTVAILHGASQALVSDCFFEFNSCFASSAQGGAIGVMQSDIDIIRCEFYYNYSSGGGAIASSQSNMTIDLCTFVGNDSSMHGGALFFGGPGETIISRSSLVSNTCGYAGGNIIYSNYANPADLTVEESILAFNRVGEALLSHFGAPTMLCCDLWGNELGDWTGNLAGLEGSNGNFSADPLFCDMGFSELILTGASPCLNTPGCGPIGANPVSCDLWQANMSILDVPQDQGGQVRITWGAHGNDIADSPYPTSSYSLWRKIDSLRSPDGDWDYLLTVPALVQEDYSTVAATLCDSTVAEGMCWTSFYIVAHGSEPQDFYESLPDSGYSLDNLEPAPPAGLQAEVDDVVVDLNWAANGESDFNYYTVWRSDQPDFSSAEQLGYTSALFWTDYLPEAGAIYYYRIIANDFAGNASDPSGAVVVNGTSSVTNIPASLFLKGAAPNPFNPSTTIKYGLPGDTGLQQVQLVIYDAAGRKVRTLVDSLQSPGHHEAVWDGRNDAGHRVSSGVYLYSLSHNADRLMDRMMLVK